MASAVDSTMPSPTSPTAERPRTKSRMSFGSHKSSGSIVKLEAKIDLTETSKDKARRRMKGGSKADPSTAIREAQPGQMAQEESTMGDLRAIQHVDSNGTPITDPDKSNPTRPRLERPLDTIRSFEAAIDGSYNKRYSIRGDGPSGRTETMGMQSRRSSYAQGPYAAGPGYSNGSVPRYAGSSYGGYSGRRMQSRPESYVESSYRQGPGGPYREDSRRMMPRNQSDPALYGNNAYYMNGQAGGYAPNNSNRPYDVATTASGSGNSHGASTEPWNNSTNPSSENSSIDRIPPHQQQAQKPSQLQIAQHNAGGPAPQPQQADLGEQYGFNGFGGVPDLQPTTIEEHPQRATAYGQNGYGPPGQQYQQPQRTYAATAGGPSNYSQQQQYPNGGRATGHRSRQQPTGRYAEMPPPPPPHVAAPPNGNGHGNGVTGRLMPRIPSKLQSKRLSMATNDYGMPAPTEKEEKRKSWLKRTFTKSK